MKRYAGRYVLTITREHILNPRSLGKDLQPVRECFGRLLPIDEGREVYEVSPGVYQTESLEQRDKRLAST